MQRKLEKDQSSWKAFLSMGKNEAEVYSENCIFPVPLSLSFFLCPYRCLPFSCLGITFLTKFNIKK